MVESVAEKVGLGHKGKDEAEEVSLPTTSEPVLTSASVRTELTPISIEVHESTVAPLPSITEALASETSSVSYTIPASTSTSTTSIEALVDETYSSTTPTLGEPTELPPASTGTITERLKRLDEDPGGFGMDIEPSTQRTVPVKKDTGKEEAKDLSQRPKTDSNEPKKPILSSLGDKLASVLPNKAPPDAPNLPGASSSVFQAMHDRAGQETSGSGNGAEPFTPTPRPISENFIFDNEPYDVEEREFNEESEIPSSYVTAAAKLARVTSRYSFPPFLPSLF